MFQVVLKDGTRFVGKKTFWASFWYDTWVTRSYKVVSSDSIPVGALVLVPMASISYRYKVKGA